MDEGHPGLEVHVTSITTGQGIVDLAARLSGSTAVLPGESGAGKSSLVNALLGTDVAATGAVREGDAKGRHTTTNRQLHVLAGGGVLIDTPGIREVGLAGDEDSVDAAFTDIDELAAVLPLQRLRPRGRAGLRGGRGGGGRGPDGGARCNAYLVLRREAAAAALRADEAAERASERQGSKGLRSFYQQHPGRKRG